MVGTIIDDICMAAERGKVQAVLEAVTTEAAQLGYKLHKMRIIKPVGGDDIEVMIGGEKIKVVEQQEAEVLGSGLWPGASSRVKEAIGRLQELDERKEDAITAFKVAGYLVNYVLPFDVRVGADAAAIRKVDQLVGSILDWVAPGVSAEIRARPASQGGLGIAPLMEARDIALAAAAVGFLLDERGRPDIAWQELGSGAPAVGFWRDAADAMKKIGIKLNGERKTVMLEGKAITKPPRVKQLRKALERMRAGRNAGVAAGDRFLARSLELTFAPTVDLTDEQLEAMIRVHAKAEVRCPVCGVTEGMVAPCEVS